MVDILGFVALLLVVIVMFVLDTDRGRLWLARQQARRATKRIWRREGRRPRDPAVVRAERQRQQQAQEHQERTQRLAAIITPPVAHPNDQQGDRSEGAR